MIYGCGQHGTHSDVPGAGMEQKQLSQLPDPGLSMSLFLNPRVMSL
jgi:hypothetical protein